MDLTEMSLQELKRLQRDLERAIASFEQRQLAAARAELEARARELGFSLADLVSADSGTAKPKRAAAQPRYRNPANPDETWSGRGRQPRWLTVALTRVGAKIEDFAI